MGYEVNYSGVDEAMEFEPLPENVYPVEIEKVEEKQTRNGDPLIRIRYKVVSGKCKNRKLFDQVVLFQGDAKGAGITKHFLHVIGEPYEGEFEIEPDNWIGKQLNVKVIVDSEYNNNKIVAREVFSDIPF